MVSNLIYNKGYRVSEKVGHTQISQNTVETVAIDYFISMLLAGSGPDLTMDVSSW